MCNLYSMRSNRTEMERAFRLGRLLVGNLPLFPAIFPAQDAPVVRIADDGTRELTMMRWGFVLPQSGRAPKDVNNARADKVSVSPFWRQSFLERRGVAPATSFCEWTDSRPKIPHWFGRDDARSLFGFPCIWRPWRGYIRKNREDVLFDGLVFSILTTAANELVKSIHAKAMPVMLTTEAQYDQWMHGSPQEALALAKPFPADSMAIVYRGETQDPGPGKSDRARPTLI